MIEIYIDGWCKYCQRFSKLIQSIDFQNNIEIKDIRVDHSDKIDIEKAKKIMASIDKNQEVVYGFMSIYRIVMHLPVLWVFAPLFYLLKILKLGDYLYNEIAVRRRIIPLSCEVDETCQVSET